MFFWHPLTIPKTSGMRSRSASDGSLQAKVLEVPGQIKNDAWYGQKQKDVFDDTT